MEAPSDYREGYDKARVVDGEAADIYVAHTRIGDPVMGAVVEELASAPQDRIHRFIQAGMDGDRGGMWGAPKLLRDFFLDAPPPGPGWQDHDAFGPGVLALQRNSLMRLLGSRLGISWIMAFPRREAYNVFVGVSPNRTRR